MSERNGWELEWKRSRPFRFFPRVGKRECPPPEILAHSFRPTATSWTYWDRKVTVKWLWWRVWAYHFVTTPPLVKSPPVATGGF